MGRPLAMVDLEAIFACVDREFWFGKSDPSAMAKLDRHGGRVGP